MTTGGYPAGPKPEGGVPPVPEGLRVPREVQMARLQVFAEMKQGIEECLEQYRASDLTNGQLAIQLFLAMAKHEVAFYLKPDP